MIMRRIIPILLQVALLVLALLLVACNSGQEEETPSETVEVNTPTSEAAAMNTPSIESPTETTVPDAEPSPDSYPGPSGYPAPSSGYPAPEGGTTESELVPEGPVVIEPLEVPPPSDSTKANIGGTLVQGADTGSPQPYQQAVIYLGGIFLDSNGQKSVAGIFEKSSPKAETDLSGNFLFENIEPGEYALFYWTPRGSVMLLEPDTGDDMLFELKAGDAINTGILSYDLTPP